MADDYSEQLNDVGQFVCELVLTIHHLHDLHQPKDFRSQFSMFPAQMSFGSIARVEHIVLTRNWSRHLRVDGAYVHMRRMDWKNMLGILCVWSLHKYLDPE